VVLDRATVRHRSLEVPVSRLAAVPARLSARLAVHDADAGMTTAEYAVGTVAACGFGGILYKVITSPEVLNLIKDVIAAAFKLSF
jgi:hypothetical protein